jgi:dihydroorotate dehydrogenase electron transfer subunit
MAAHEGSITLPAVEADGTLTARVEAPARWEHGTLWLSLVLPGAVDSAHAAGRFVLARCGAHSPAARDEQWSIYLRRPLFPAGQPRILPAGQQSLWRFAAAGAGLGRADPGLRWLAAQDPGAPVNLTGPFGSGFPLPPLTRRLLLVADVPHLPLVLPLLDAALDRGAQVSLLLLCENLSGIDVGALRAGLPLAVEVHQAALAAATSPAGAADLDQSLRWCDQVCIAVDAAHLPPLAEAVRRVRIRFDAGFAFAFLDADLACGYGACLACVVPLANGSLTRACIHGPVFDLLEIAGKG